MRPHSTSQRYGSMKLPLAYLGLGVALERDDLSAGFGGKR